MILRKNISALFVAITVALSLFSCSSTKKIAQESEPAKVVIVYYDVEIGPKPLEKTIVDEHCEIIYRYNNFNAFALKIKSEATRKKLENTKGVLSVQDDRKLELQ